MTLEQLNILSAEQFVELLGGIYEHSPWVAAGVLAQRPFESPEALAAAMAAVVADADESVQMILIRAHPELGGRLRVAKTLTPASRDEQRGAGLDQCSAEEFATLQSLNSAYQQRFGFPFIVAVKGHSRESIIAAMRNRMENDVQTEKAEALEQIDRIAGFRLTALLTADPA